MRKYKIDQYNSVYIYDESQGCFIYAGNLNGKSEDEFISEYEAQESYSLEDLL